MVVAWGLSLHDQYQSSAHYDMNYISFIYPFPLLLYTASSHTPDFIISHPYSILSILCGILLVSNPLITTECLGIDNTPNYQQIPSFFRPTSFSLSSTITSLILNLISLSYYQMLTYPLAVKRVFQNAC